MKNAFKLLKKQIFTAVATVALVAGMATSALAGFGPNRTTRAWTPQENGFDHITFNSFTGVPNGIGDERDFLRGVQVGRDSVWSDPVNSVTQDAEVEMKIYIHNNADEALNTVPDGKGGFKGIAKNVTVRAALPTTAAQAQQVTSYIKADNATPTEIFDTLDITGANGGFFELSYVNGKAKMIEQNGQSTVLTAQQESDLISTGLNIGDVKGCFKYVKEITFRVKVKMPRTEIQKTARLNGEDSTKWRKAVNTKIGDKVDFRIWVKNSGKTDLKSIMIVDDLPSHVTLVPGTIKQFKGANSQVLAEKDVVQNNGRRINMNAGDFKPGDDTYLVFTVTVNNDEKIRCGIQTLVNTAFATPQGYGAITDNASVNVVNDNKCVGPSYICESATVDIVKGRKVHTVVKAPVSGNAKVKAITYNYGDGSTAKVTDKLVDDYEYKADGTYKITTTVTFTVDGTDKVVTSDNCAKVVSFGSTPKTLVKTGPGSVVGLFAATSVIGAAGHYVVSRRRA